LVLQHYTTLAKRRFAASGTRDSVGVCTLYRFKKANISCENIKAFALLRKARACSIADKRINLKVTSV